MSSSVARAPSLSNLRVLASVAPPSGVRERTETLPPPPAGARRIVVVDDEGPRREAVLAALQVEGYTVTALPLGTQALGLIQRAAADLVLIAASDAEAPGVRFCRELRAVDAGHRIPIVLFGGDGSDEDMVVRALHAGADDYVCGTARVYELRARVRVQLHNLRDRELLRWAREQRSVYRHAALTDPLTGIANRRALDARLAMTLHGCQPTLVLLLDVDRFKVVNDTWGHALGDEVLRRVATSLERQARREDLVGRFGGEEFMVVVHDTPAEHAQAIAERYRESIRAMSLPDGPERVTVSVGVASWDGEGPAPQALTLIARADEALYLAKREGRDQVRVYAPPGAHAERRDQNSV
jgi:two-component system cell cycle response regulator